MEKEIEYASVWINSQEDKETIWNFMKQEPSSKTGFMFMRDPILERISRGVECRGHSGSSFALTLRGVQKIAREMSLDKK